MTENNNETKAHVDKLVERLCKTDQMKLQSMAQSLQESCGTIKHLCKSLPTIGFLNKSDVDMNKRNKTSLSTATTVSAILDDIKENDQLQSNFFEFDSKRKRHALFQSAVNIENY